MTPQEIWNQWCRSNRVQEKLVPLFSEVDGHVEVIAHGRDRRPILARSSEFNSAIKTAHKELSDDCSNKTNRFDGMLYMLCWKDGENVVPLYVGKSDKLGRTGNLNSDIRDFPYGRWDNDRIQHMGALSEATLEYYIENRSEKNSVPYRRWAEVLFEKYPCSSPVLRRQTFMLAKNWGAGSTSIWEELNPTTLPMEENLLIAVAKKVSPILLNRQGV